MYFSTRIINNQLSSALSSTNEKIKLQCYCDIFKENFTVNHDFVQRYGSYKIKDTNDNKDKTTQVIIDKKFLTTYPELLDNK